MHDLRAGPPVRPSAPGAIYEHTQRQSAESAELWAFAAVATVLLGLPCALQLVEQRRDILFRRWILAHWDDIAAGRATLDGVQVGPDTELVRHRVVISMIIVHTRICGRPVLPGTAAATTTKWVSTLVTGVAGWWFWSGPFWTIGALWANLRGRTIRIRMADVAKATAKARSLDDVDLDA